MIQQPTGWSGLERTLSPIYSFIYPRETSRESHTQQKLRIFMGFTGLIILAAGVGIGATVPKAGLYPTSLIIVLLATAGVLIAEISWKAFQRRDLWLGWGGFDRETEQRIEEIAPEISKSCEEILIACGTLDHEIYQHDRLYKAVLQALTQGARLTIIFDGENPSEDNPYVKLSRHYRGDVSIRKTSDFQFERHFTVVTDRNFVRIEEPHDPDDQPIGRVVTDTDATRNLCVAFRNYWFRSIPLILEETETHQVN